MFDNHLALMVGLTAMLAHHSDIGMDCFYLVKFYLLQTLFRLGPRGPRKCQSRVHLRRAKSFDGRLYLNFAFEGNH